MDHTKESGTINYWFPETLYILSAQGIYGSTTANNITGIYNPEMIRSKIHPTEFKLFYKAYQYLLLHHQSVLQQSTNTNTNRWTTLQYYLFEQNVTIPFLAHYSDYKGCNYHNWRMSGGDDDNNVLASIPLFTVAADVHCQYTFPIPNYRTIGYHTMQSKEQWKRYHSKSIYTNDIPYEDKLSQVVWRGSLTGYFNVTYRPIRYQVLQYIHNTIQNETDRELFNVYLSNNRYHPDIKNYLDIEMIEKELGGIGNSINPMIEYQQYKGILDMDGHSWSARFGNLLCYQSVILKIEPDYVDYFYYPINTTVSIQPWKHYIPIKKDLSDLIEKTQYIMDPNNYNHIKQIISNSNEWCYERMVTSSVLEDMLDIWEQYVTLLDTTSPNWSSTKWNNYVIDSNLLHVVNTNTDDNDDDTNDSINDQQQQHHHPQKMILIQ